LPSKPLYFTIPTAALKTLSTAALVPAAEINITRYTFVIIARDNQAVMSDMKAQKLILLEGVQ
jgi:hypothetical protein